MGFDISYHPLAESEIAELYFKPLEDPTCAEVIGKKFNLGDDDLERLLEIYQAGRDTDSDEFFNSSHGFHIAVSAGVVRKYWYVRGGAISFAFEDDELAIYTKPWAELIPERFRSGEIENAITENYMAGCYLTHDGLKRLREDYDSNPEVKSSLDEKFSHGRLEVFFRALDFAVENNVGLVEASEVIFPNPLDPAATECYAKFENCEKDGFILYIRAAQEQMEQLMSEQSEETETIKQKDAEGQD